SPSSSGPGSISFTGSVIGNPRSVIRPSAWSLFLSIGWSGGRSGSGAGFVRRIPTSTKRGRRARMGGEGTMADYFLVLDAATFEGRARPALAAAWRARSFVPCRDLCAALTPSAHSYAERYHTGAGEPLLCQVFRGLPFDRGNWRTLVGEVLLFSALEIPEF